MLRNRQPREASGELPGYSDLDQVASDGATTRYRAIEVDTGRPVTILALQTAHLQNNAALRLDRDLRALAFVSMHPNIVTLYRRLSLPDGRRGLVMELCRTTLAERVAAGPLESQVAASIGVKVAAALQTAHLAGVLHGDLTPGNVQMTDFDEPLLDGLGLAALSGPGARSDAHFTAPELLEGAEPSPASDVYGLASTLYELVAGKPPFTAFAGEPQAAVILRILTEQPAQLRDPNVPVVLADLIEWAMSKDPSGRPASPLVFAEELRAIERAHDWEVTGLVLPAAATAPAARPEAPVPSAALLAPPGTVVPLAAPGGREPDASFATAAGASFAGTAGAELAAVGEPATPEPHTPAPSRLILDPPTPAPAPAPAPAPTPGRDRSASLVEPAFQGRSVSEPEAQSRPTGAWEHRGSAWAPPPEPAGPEPVSPWAPSPAGGATAGPDSPWAPARSAPASSSPAEADSPSAQAGSPAAPQQPGQPTWWAPPPPPPPPPQHPPPQPPAPLPPAAEEVVPSPRPASPEAAPSSETEPDEATSPEPTRGLWWERDEPTV